MLCDERIGSLNTLVILTSLYQVETTSPYVEQHDSASSPLITCAICMIALPYRASPLQSSWTGEPCSRVARADSAAAMTLQTQKGQQGAHGRRHAWSFARRARDASQRAGARPDARVVRCSTDPPQDTAPNLHELTKATQESNRARTPGSMASSYK